LKRLGIQLTQDVIDGINEELEYTDSLPDMGRSDGIDHGTAGQILTLQSYARRAGAAWVQNPGNDAALHELRKVAAIACRALVRDGCPKRTVSKRVFGIVTPKVP